MRKVAAVTWAMLLHNRWQLLLLGAWPWLFLLLLQAGGAISPEDVVSLLHQECLYGLAMIAILASSAFGNELRSRRIVFVLSRAISRQQYLTALWLSAIVPGLVYVLSMLGAGVILGSSARLSTAAIVSLLMVLLVLMLWVGALGLMFSILLPGFLPWAAVSVAAPLIFYWSGPKPSLGSGMLLRSIMDSGLAQEHAHFPALASVSSTLLQACGLFLGAYFLFRRKDICPSGD